VRQIRGSFYTIWRRAAAKRIREYPGINEPIAMQVLKFGRQTRSPDGKNRDGGMTYGLCTGNQWLSETGKGMAKSRDPWQSGLEWPRLGP
jgi:hypothetical protein